jgi:AraC family transcriptional regulator of adaptative response / DNA-3-methyladenine glycosylase II
LIPIVARLRRLFDLDAEPWVIAQHLAKDRRLARRLDAQPGLRVPGAFDPFEAACRAILGQQVSVAAATTLAGRVAQAYGELIETPYTELSRLTPRVERIARAEADALMALGLTGARARSLQRLAQEIASGGLSLDTGADAEGTVQRLQELPGIGPWTAEYVAMRALSWPDAFVAGDLGVQKALGSVGERRARTLSEAWRPWRAYAVMHLWTSPM